MVPTATRPLSTKIPRRTLRVWSAAWWSENKDFLDLVANARKHSRILIKAIEESYKEARIDIATIEQENDIMFEIMEATEELTDKIQVKFNTIK